MNIKSLLLGSAAAFAVVSGAQAADAVVAAAPEPMEYVKVCDAFGTGYFYIPGTETCLKIGGMVRLDLTYGNNAPLITTTNPGYKWSSYAGSQFRVNVEANRRTHHLEPARGYVGALAIDDAARRCRFFDWTG